MADEVEGTTRRVGSTRGAKGGGARFAAFRLNHPDGRAIEVGVVDDLDTARVLSPLSLASLDLLFEWVGTPEFVEEAASRGIRVELQSARKEEVT